MGRKNNDLEKRLNEVLADQSAPLEEATGLLKKSVTCRTCKGSLTYIDRYRSASEDIVLRDLPAARSSNVETRLWNAHSRINLLYRKRLSKVSGAIIYHGYIVSCARSSARKRPAKMLKLANS